MSKKTIFLAFLLGIFVVATPAFAESYKSVVSEEEQSSPAATSTTTRENVFKGEPTGGPNNLYFNFGLNYFNSFGVDGRYGFRLVKKGPIPNLNNSLFVEGGAGLTFYGTINTNPNVTGFHVIVDARWDFQIDQNWVIFGKVGLGLNAVSNAANQDVAGGGFFPAVGIGGMYNFDQDWSARADISYDLLGAGLVRRF